MGLGLVVQVVVLVMQVEGFFFQIGMFSSVEFLLLPPPGLLPIELVFRFVGFRALNLLESKRSLSDFSLDQRENFYCHPLYQW